MSVINSGEQKKIYITNTLGERTGHKEINESIYTWFNKNRVENNWLQCLVELNGDIGILALKLFLHPNSLDWDRKQYYNSDAWQKSTSQEIWTHLESVARQIDSTVDFDVLLGKETGLMARHEVCIWFPFGTNKDIIEQNFMKIKDILLLY